MGLSDISGFFLPAHFGFISGDADMEVPSGPAALRETTGPPLRPGTVESDLKDDVSLSLLHL